VWLDSNSHQDKYSSFEACLAIGESKVFSNLDDLTSFVGQNRDWLFGYFSYDLKNQIEDLESENMDQLGFQDLHFFQPHHILI